MPFSRGSSQPGIKSGSLQFPALAGGFFTTAAAAAKSLQSCLTLCDPIDGSLPVSPVPGILQAGVLEWGAIAFSQISYLKYAQSLTETMDRVKGTLLLLSLAPHYAMLSHFSRVRLCVTP